MSGTDPAGLLEAVSTREELLTALGTDGVTKTELKDRLGAARTTVDRTVRELMDHGLVERTEEGYRRTLFGEFALAAYRTYAAEVEGIERANDVLSVLSASVDIDPCLLADATVIRRTTGGEQQPQERVDEMLDRATRFDAFGPVVYPTRLGGYRDRVVDGLTVRMLLTDGAVQRMIVHFPDGLAEMLACDGFEFRQTDYLPYTLIVAETDDGPWTCLVTYKEGIHGLVENDTPEAVEWAREEFRRRWEGADPLSALGIE